MNISFKTMQRYCKYAGFCFIRCKNPKRKKRLPPLFPLCLEDRCPAIDRKVYGEESTLDNKNKEE